MNVEFMANVFGNLYQEGRSFEKAEEELVKQGFPAELAKGARAEFERRLQRVRLIERPARISRRELREWYGGPKSDDRCWPHLKGLLQNKGWADDIIGSVDESSTRVVSLLDCPGDESFATRGLVLGYVQSGKTANFTAVIAKAADAGYKLIIVLGGIHNALRAQTQRRLEDELIGGDRAHWHRLTSEEHDFKAQGNADSFLTDAGNQRVLCVVKKNATVLRRLVRWFRGADRYLLKRVPVLVVDDEADQASLNTGTNEERSRINDLVIELMKTFTKCAYVGYTATPFANVLVDPSWPENLYPRDFIVDLPRPDNYFGTERIFGATPTDHGEGDDAGGLDLVRVIDEEEVPLLRPSGTSSQAAFQPEMTPSLAVALRWFLLASAARLVRGQANRHMGMLVHVTLYTNIHDRLCAVLEDEIGQIRTGFERRARVELSELQRIWDEETRRMTAASMGEKPVSWEEVVAKLPEVFRRLKVAVDHGKSSRRLYYPREGGSIQVVVGGNTLSRGLTIEGLMVSFFLRASSTYDTLLQMGRWFGYRDGYADLPRIWMTEALKDDFLHLARVEGEIREDVARYEREDATPLDFAVRIRTHSTLAITSQMKMQAAIESNVSYTGEVKQTTYFEVDDLAWLTNNLEAARTLLDHADRTCAVEDVWGAHQLWRAVPVERVREFLERYLVHERHQDMRAERLRDYIKAQVDVGSLLRWNVAVVGQASQGARRFDGLLPGGRPVPLINRSRLASSPLANVKAIMSMTDRAIDLGLPAAPREHDVGERLGSWIAERRSPVEDRALPSDPARGLRTPLLLLYPIDKDSQPREGVQTRVPLAAVEHVIGLALVFPHSRHDTPRSYMTVDLSHVERDILPDADVDEDEA